MGPVFQPDVIGGFIPEKSSVKITQRMAYLMLYRHFTYAILDADKVAFAHFQICAGSAVGTIQPV
jgi:hypothetical protein